MRHIVLALGKLREVPRDTIATIDEKPIYNQRKTNKQSSQNQQAIKVKPTPLKK